MKVIFYPKNLFEKIKNLNYLKLIIDHDFFSYSLTSFNVSRIYYKLASITVPPIIISSIKA